MPENTLLRDLSLAELVVDNLPHQVIVIDRDWNIVCWNQAAEQYTGLSRTNCYGEKLQHMLPHIVSDLPLMRAFESAMLGYSSVLPIDPGNATRGLREYRLIPLKNKQDKVIGVLNLIHDLDFPVAPFSDTFAAG